MHRNILTAGLGVVAAAAMLVGNGTFASWSDSSTNSGNSVGASELQLNVGNSGTARFDKLNLIPGGSADFEFYVASRDAAAVPLADLAMQIVNLADTEDGCSNTSGEQAADSNCADLTSAGEFSSQANIVVNVSQPTSDPATACDQPRGNVTVKTIKQLRDAGSLNLLGSGSLAPGQGICVALGIQLPVSATNAVQGDSSTFDIQFDLTQRI